MKHKLYLVSTPIGNKDDITLRALKILQSSDVIVCEELKPARRLLAGYDIQKELIPLNEHNENESARDVINLIQAGKQVALISDCGAPLFSDPGHLLVDLCIRNKIQVVPLPGGNSLIPALISSGFDIEKFYYYGWLSPNKTLRRKELKQLTGLKELLVILDTPYRLEQLISDVALVFGKQKSIAVGYKLTMEEEQILRGTAESVLKEIQANSLKGEFVLLINNRN